MLFPLTPLSDKLFFVYFSSLILFNILTRALNSSSLLIRTRHITRIGIASGFFLLGFCLLAICCSYSENVICFYFALVASVFFGVASSLGESTILGFLRNMPCQSIGYYGSGTGLAGISGAFLFMFMTALGLSSSAIFTIIAPTTIVYFITFMWLDR